MAALEEFLQERYVENYDNLDVDNNKVEELMKINEYSRFFYIPSNEGIGTLKYVVDSDGHALYLINKSGLPDEIREVLIGGDAGNKTYSYYASLNDVYGVTKNLKVYYCSNGVDSILGLAKENLDVDNQNRDVFTSEKNKGIVDLLGSYDKNGDGKLSFLETKSISKLTINKDSGITDFSDFYNFVNLQELTLDNLNLKNLNGIENISRLNYIYIKNCTIENYSNIGLLGKSLKYLYFYNVTDTEVEKLCDKSVGISNYELPNLEYFAISGTENYICSTVTSFDSIKSENIIKSIEPLENFNDTTKKAIKYVSLQNNNLTDISTLDDFTNIYLLRLENNSLKNLTGIKNLNNLAYLYTMNNSLGEGELSTEKNSEVDSLAPLEGKKKLNTIDITNNQNVIWVDYLASCEGIKRLYLANCPNFNLTSVGLITKLYRSIDYAGDKSIDSKYLQYLNTGDKLYYSGLKSDNSEDLAKVDYLLNLDGEDCEKVKSLDLNGSTLDNGTLNNIISKFPELVSLNVNNCKYLSSLDFTSETTKLEQILFLNTNVSGDEVEKFDQNCSSLVSIKCNNRSINLTKMQNTISRCKMYTGDYCFESYLSLGLQDSELVSQLAECTKITQLSLYSIPNNYKITLDLSSLNNLSIVTIYNANNCNIILPTSIKTFDQFRATSDAVNLTVAGKCEITTMNFRNWGDEKGRAVSFFNSLSSTDSSIKNFNLELYGWEGDYDILNYLSEFKIENLKLFCNSRYAGKLTNSQFNLTNWNNKLCMLKTLTINDGIVSTNNLDFLENNTSLEKLIFINGNISDIDGIRNLNLLNEINLSKNAITNLDAIKGLNNLKILNLNNNSIEQKYGDIDNLQILADLNYQAKLGGVLQELHLSDNPVIWGNTPIEKLQWVVSEGF